jgi:hypothetical protein
VAGECRTTGRGGTFPGYFLAHGFPPGYGGEAGDEGVRTGVLPADWVPAAP